MTEEESIKEEASVEPGDTPSTEAPVQPSPESDAKPAESDKAEATTPKIKSEVHVVEAPSVELGSIDRTVSNEEPGTVDGDLKSGDEALKKSRASVGRDELGVKKGRKSSMSLGERRMSRLDDLGRKSIAKRALGSIIDIRRPSYTGEVLDKKAARFMNTYKMDSDNPFNSEKVDAILESVMIEALENLTYDPDKCPKQAKWASMSIRARVKALDFDRYKIVCVVTIGEKHSQDVFVACRFLWDADRDRYSTFSMENTYVFGIAQCFGLYYE